MQAAIVARAVDSCWVDAQQPANDAVFSYETIGLALELELETETETLLWGFLDRSTVPNEWKALYVTVASSSSLSRVYPSAWFGRSIR